jgi:hypothetical protein
MWAKQSSNNHYWRTMKKREILRQTGSLKSVHSHVDNTSPRPVSHLKSNSKRKQVKTEQALHIQSENRILLQKMLNIDLQRSNLNTGNTSKRSLVPLNLKYKR